MVEKCTFLQIHSFVFSFNFHFCQEKIVLLICYINKSIIMFCLTKCVFCCLLTILYERLCNYLNHLFLPANLITKTFCPYKTRLCSRVVNGFTCLYLIWRFYSSLLVTYVKAKYILKTHCKWNFSSGITFENNNPNNRKLLSAHFFPCR